MPHLAYYVFSALVLSVLISLIRKSARAERQRREEEILREIYRTGKVLYRRKVYCVREVCDSGPYSAKRTRERKYLIICKDGEERVFRIPLEEAEPCA